MDFNDTNARPPALEPSYPTWPVLPEICRIPGTGGSSSSSSSSSGSGGVSGPNVYAAFVQQWVPGPQLRDRVACYILEPNGVRLGPGYYYCRLMGVHPVLTAPNDLMLPLYVTCFQLAGGSVAGNLFVTGALLAGLSIQQINQLVTNLTPGQIAILVNLNPCQLQTFLTLPVVKQQTLTNNLTPTQLTNLLDNLTTTVLTNIVNTLTTGQIQNLTATLTATQIENLTATLTATQIQNLVNNLTPTQLQSLVQYTPVDIGLIVTYLTTPQQQTLLNLVPKPPIPVLNLIGQSSSNSVSPPVPTLLSTSTTTGPPTWTPTSGTYPVQYTLTDKKLWAWDGSAWNDITGGGGSPGGANTDVQYNDSGSMGGDANFTWDKTNKRLKVTGAGGISFTIDASNGTTGVVLDASTGNIVVGTATDNLSFFGFPAAAKQTVSGTLTGATLPQLIAVVQSLMAALGDGAGGYGLVKDSTT